MRTTASPETLFKPASAPTAYIPIITKERSEMAVRMSERFIYDRTDCIADDDADGGKIDKMLSEDMWEMKHRLRP